MTMVSKLRICTINATNKGSIDFPTTANGSLPIGLIDFYQNYSLSNIEISYHLNVTLSTFITFTRWLLFFTHWLLFFCHLFASLLFSGILYKNGYWVETFTRKWEFWFKTSNLELIRFYLVYFAPVQNDHRIHSSI